jgi:hypothetical protein
MVEVKPSFILLTFMDITVVIAIGAVSRCPFGRQSVHRRVGDIIYSRLLGQDYMKVARTLSDARHSVVYADRPMLSIFEL